MNVDPVIENLLLKILRAAKNERDVKRYFNPFEGNWKPVPYQFDDAAGNHVFDDFPEIFGLTEDEGHQVRHFFQSQSKGTRYNPHLFEYIQDLFVRIATDS